MAKRKLVWTHTAKIKLFQILDFYKQRNGNASYSIKLFQQIKKDLALLVNQPEIGIKTDLEGVRGLIIAGFVVFYEISSATIIIHTIWDCRQNPDDLVIK